MADNRMDLVNQLAASMGAGDFANTKYTESKYDAQTGTLYCDGIMIAKPVIEKAEQYFRGLKSKCSYTDPASREMAMIYQLALEGIKMIKASGNETGRENKQL